MNHCSLHKVARFLLPRQVLRETEEHLRAYGEESLEARILWVGKYTGKAEFQFTRTILPEQDCGPVDTTVDHDELLRISRELYEQGETLAAQIHTHPGAAFHSATDNAEPITRELGALSIVVPDYCQTPLTNLDHCATFRLSEFGWCGPYPVQLLRQLILIQGDPE